MGLYGEIRGRGNLECGSAQPSLRSFLTNKLPDSTIIQFLKVVFSQSTCYCYQYIHYLNWLVELVGPPSFYHVPFRYGTDVVNML